MKNAILLIVLAIFSLLPFSATGEEQMNKAGLGFEFGTSFYSFSKSNFKTGGGNFFRLNLQNPSGGQYFLHNENGNISVEVGDATTTLTSNVVGIGSGIKIGESFFVKIMVGNATVLGTATTGTGTNAIAAVQSTSPVGDIGFGWKNAKGSVSFNAGLVYRYHVMSSPIVLTDSSGKAESVNDLGSMNLDVSITYSF